MVWIWDQEFGRALGRMSYWLRSGGLFWAKEGPFFIGSLAF
jgi:hypothetical protein